MQRQGLIDRLKKFPRTYSGLVLTYYFFRFLYFSFKERSLWFCRYPPGHYGSTIPSAVDIRKERSALFGAINNSNDGIDLNASVQKKMLEDIAILFPDFSPAKTASASKRYFYDNPMFGFNDGFVLYAFMRLFRPSRIVEVGSGYSSALMMDTAEEFLPDSRFAFIDPYSTSVGPLLQGSACSNHEIVRERVQDVKLSIFEELKENDFLFVDSSHVVKIGSDLSTILFSIFPALAKGVIVHIHDIFYPFEYPETMIAEGRIWNEVYFVRTFLQYNRSFEIIFFSSFVEKTYQDYINRHMPGYSCGSGYSLWLRKIA